MISDRDLWRIATAIDGRKVLRHRRRAGMETARQQKRRIKRYQRHVLSLRRDVETSW